MVLNPIALSKISLFSWNLDTRFFTPLQKVKTPHLGFKANADNRKNKRFFNRRNLREVQLHFIIVHDKILKRVGNFKIFEHTIGKIPWKGAKINFRGWLYTNANTKTLSRGTPFIFMTVYGKWEWRWWKRYCLCASVFKISWQNFWGFL